MGFWAGIKRRALDNGVVSVALQNGYRHYRVLRMGLDAYQHLAAELASVRDERDRILRSLETLRTGKTPLPPGLRGRQLCFLHIGKTAGTSVQHALFDAMQGTAILHESLQNFDTVSAAEMAINDLVIGHFGYQHVAKLRADRFLMTFLRDPVERVISNYHFLRSGSPISRYSQCAIGAAKALTLSEFLRCEEPGVRMITENFQAKALAFDIRPEHQHAIGDLHREAARNLATFDFVGIVEYFPESMLALSDAIGREVPIKRLNTTAERLSASAVAPDDLELIRRLNAVDIALYTAAKARFERTILPMLRSRGITARNAEAADRGQQRNLFDIPRAIVCAIRADEELTAVMNPISVAIKRVYAAARDIEGCFLKGGDHRYGSEVAEF